MVPVQREELASVRIEGRESLRRNQRKVGVYVRPVDRFMPARNAETVG
jgi:hypothetical protein